ncbi:MAG: DUF2007 domain-containing protein [Oscillospiraceae bacterium]|nr:DUF2007 domain-containing protein [Oscillospiraceae bacterium]
MSDWSFRKKKPVTANWPKDENGEPYPPVFLEHASGGPVDVELAVNLLEAYGIPVVTQLPNNGDFAQVIMGMTGTGVDIFVPQNMLEDAQNILSADIVEEPEDDE